MNECNGKIATKIYNPNKTPNNRISKIRDTQSIGVVSGTN